MLAAQKERAGDSDAASLSSRSLHHSEDAPLHFFPPLRSSEIVTPPLTSSSSARGCRWAAGRRSSSSSPRISCLGSASGGRIFSRGKAASLHGRGSMRSAADGRINTEK